MSWIERLRSIGRRFALITDQQVETLYGTSLKRELEAQGFAISLFAFPAGEKSKSRAVKQWLEDQMSAAGFGREDGVIALGGGVVNDLAGFVAATYCRGIPFVAIPTTLLAMVDASIGGKVGVNTPYGKNLIGAFHSPRFVVIDTTYLGTLSPKLMREGLSEIIKYALIASSSLFERLHATPLAWKILIRESCTIKQKVVSQDPQERGGLRRILNFGHTIGHALETASDYTLPHGEAIAIGMLVEAYLSCQMGLLSEEELKQIIALFQHHCFPLQLPLIDEALFLSCLTRDKKASSQIPRFVLLKHIGEPLVCEGAYCCTVPKPLLHQAIQWMFHNYTSPLAGSLAHS